MSFIKSYFVYYDLFVNVSICMYLATENSFNEIIQKENIHKSDFESIISQMEKNISELKLCIEDSKLVANIL